MLVLNTSGSKVTVILCRVRNTHWLFLVPMVKYKWENEKRAAGRAIYERVSYKTLVVEILSQSVFNQVPS